MTSATTLCAITYNPAPSHLWLTTVAINIGIISAKVSSRHVTQATRHFRVWHVSGDWGNLMGSSQDLNGKLTSSDARELGRHLSVFLNIWCITLMKYKIHSDFYLKIFFVFNASLHNFWMLYKLRRETIVNAETQDTACFEYPLNTAELSKEHGALQKPWHPHIEHSLNSKSHIAKLLWMWAPWFV